MRQSLFANAGYLVGVEATNSLIGFLFWALATQLYAPAEIGLASSVISAVALVSLIAGLGTGNGLIRFLPESRQPNCMLNSVFIFNITTAFLVGVIFLLGLPFFSPTLSFLRQGYLIVIGFLVYGIAATFTTSLRMTFLALRQARYALWQSVSINGSRLLLLIVFAGIGIWGLVGSVWFAVSMSLLLGFFVFLRRAKPDYHPRISFSRSDLLLILPYSFGIYLAFLLIQAPARLLPILVLELIGPTAAAHAQIAWLVGGILVTPGLALATSAFVEASNSPTESSSIYTKAGMAGLLTTILAASFMIVVAPWFLLLFGPGYSIEGTALLRWLAATAPLVVVVGIYFSHLRFQKRVRHLVALSAVVAVSTLGFAATFISIIGISAFGLGWFFGYFLVALLATREVLAGNSVRHIWLRIQ